MQDKDGVLEQIDDIADRHRLNDYHAVIVWFTRTMFGVSDDKALEAVCDGSHDRGIDAVLIDDTEKLVTIVQSKFSREIGVTNIRESDVRNFAAVREMLKSRNALTGVIKTANERTAALLEKAYQLVRRSGYGFQLLFLTTNRKPPELDDFIEHTLDFSRFQFAVYDSKKLVDLYRDEMRDYVPSTGSYNLHFRDEDQVLLRKGGINSWVLTVPLEEIRSLVTKYERDLFRKNVRNFLGTNKTNKAIRRTLETEPGSFWYYNNGITVLCDEASLVPEHSYIRLVNPQVVNGCQTAKSIKLFRSELAGDVMVRVIQSSDHEFIHSITLAQNTSNPVRSRDFRSNDPIQIRLKRELARRHLYLEIKRGEEFKDLKKDNPVRAAECVEHISNEDVAKLLACVRIGPSVALSRGSEVFFEDLYDRLFPEGISTSDVLAPWILEDWIRGSYAGPEKRFHTFDKAYKFKKRGSFYVLAMMYGALRKARIKDWERKLVEFWLTPDEGEWPSLRKKFHSIVDGCFETLYNVWIKDGKRELRTYLQDKDTAKGIVRTEKRRWTHHAAETAEFFREILA